MKCKDCGRLVLSNWTRCHNCGKKFEGEAQFKADANAKVIYIPEEENQI